MKSSMESSMESSEAVVTVFSCFAFLPLLKMIEMQRTMNYIYETNLNLN